MQRLNESELKQVQGGQPEPNPWHHIAQSNTPTPWNGNGIIGINGGSPWINSGNPWINEPSPWNNTPQPWLGGVIQG